MAHVRAEEAIAISKVEAIESVGARVMAAAYALSESEAQYAAQSPNGIARISYAANATAAAMTHVIQSTARKLS